MFTSVIARRGTERPDRARRIATGHCCAPRDDGRLQTPLGLYDCLVQNRGDDLQLASTVRAVLAVQIKAALEERGPIQQHWAVTRTIRLTLGGPNCAGARDRPLDTTIARPGVRCQHAVEANQVKWWPWRQRNQRLHDLKWRHHQMRGAVAQWCILRLTTIWTPSRLGSARR